MSIRFNDIYVRMNKVKAGDKEDLVNSIIDLLSNEDSNGNNGAEYMPDKAFEYFGFDPANPDAVDEANEELGWDSDKIYCLDRYAFETAMKIDNERKMISHLEELYEDSWGHDAYFTLDFLRNKKDQITVVAAAFVS